MNRNWCSLRSEFVLEGRAGNRYILYKQRERFLNMNCSCSLRSELVVAIASVESRERKRQHVCLFPHLYLQFKCMYVCIVQCERVKACVHAFLYTRFHTFKLNSHWTHISLQCMPRFVHAYTPHTLHIMTSYCTSTSTHAPRSHTHTLSLSLAPSWFSLVLSSFPFSCSPRKRALSLLHARTHHHTNG